MGRGYGVAEYLGYPRQSSKCNPGIEQPLNWENDICVLSPVAPDGELRLHKRIWKQIGDRVRDLCRCFEAIERCYIDGIAGRGDTRRKVEANDGSFISRDSEDVQVRVGRAQALVANSERCLLVVDNVRDVDGLPRTASGHSKRSL